MKESKFFCKYKSPIGNLYLIRNTKGLEKIALDYEKFLNYSVEKKLIDNKELFKDIRIQLDEYFYGSRKRFSIPIDIKGTEFQKLVWNRVNKIPYGVLKSYTDIALEINNPLAVRAIGQANKNNPLPIIIPCHRVVGKNGKMVGYAGDKISLKEILIKLERDNLIK
ncbi:methylated-DNA--[protein]-cysteine S-methyltransferase [Clostridium botulinum]|nr:methylated-DNA--[protein]-cysteine S-methyltransferase [Clostridium botulinum]